MKTTFLSRLAKGAAIAAAATLALTACEHGVVGSPDHHYFTVANGAAEGTHNAVIAEGYMDAVEEATDGRIEFNRTAFETVCSMDEVADCVRDGRADIGLTVNDYTPHLLPTLSVMSITFLNTDIQASVEALYDVHTNYEPAREQLERANLEYISAWPVGTLLIGAKEPVDNLDDVRGLSARVSGPVTQVSMEAAGVNVNAITAAEAYESIQRGVIDSAAGALDFAVNFQVTEQLPYWADPGLGQYTSYGMWWNKDSYDSLDPELKAIVDEVTREFNEGRTIELLNDELENICQGMLDAPQVEDFSSWDDEAAQEWVDLAGADAESAWLDIMDDYNFEGAEEFLNEYIASYESFESADNPEDAGIVCADRWQELHN